jgi:hypothetical protein
VPTFDGTAEAVPYKAFKRRAQLEIEMIFQLSWTTLPGLRGLSCSEFRATPIAAPDNERGVAVECETEAQRDALLRELEAHFGPKRFLNTAAAFDAVKDFAISRSARLGL